MSFFSASQTVGPQTLANGHPYFSEKIAPQQEEKDLQGPFVVLGFSGARVIDLAEDIVQIIQHELKSHPVAIVCSEKSCNTRMGGITNHNERMTRLLCAAREAVKHKSRSYVAIVKGIQIDHLEPAKPLLHSPAILANYTKLVNAECDCLIKILESVQYLGEVGNSVEDRIIGKVENLSCIFVAAVLQDRGVDAQYIDLSDVVPGDLSSALRKGVVACGKRVPVMTRFFKVVPGGLTDAIGKSFADLCAAPVAAGVGAKELQIWTEVDGFFTADPRRVPDARLIPSVTPSEATQLASQGSEDIEAFIINQVIRARIPIRIKSVMNPHGSGTMICLDDVAEAPSGFGTPAALIADRKGLVEEQSTFAFAPASHSKRPTAVIIKDRILLLNVHSNKQTRAHGFLMNIFKTLEKWHLSVDLGSSSEVHVSMAMNLDARPLGTDEQLQYAVEELNEYGNVDLVPDMAIISLIGHQLKNIVGISGTFFSVLGANDINIEMISQGASEIAISCVIDKRDANRALNILHAKFFSSLE